MKNLSVWKIITCAIVAGLVIIGASIGMGLGIKKPEKTYTVEVVANLENAQCTGAGQYKIGDEVTLEAGEVEDYVFVAWTFNNQRVSRQNPYTFKLAENNIGQYKAEYGVEHTVSAAAVSNGTIAVSIQKAVASDWITVTLTPNSGFEVGEVYYIAEGNENHVPITDSGFYMPDNNVTVYATFVEAQYDITVDDEIANGHISVELTKASVGTSVAVSVVPDTGYRIKKVFYTVGLTEYEIIDDEGYRFDMPEDEVFVSAEFELDE